jgi:hypothetical protein
MNRGQQQVYFVSGPCRQRLHNPRVFEIEPCLREFQALAMEVMVLVRDHGVCPLPCEVKV